MPIQTEAPSRKSWRDVLPIHPAAELFPPMSSDELRELGADIVKKNGLVAPIALWRRNPNEPLQLLDGRNRLDAIELVTGRTVEVGAPSLMAGDFLATDKVLMLDKSVEPFAYVISANIHRRHLDAEQKRNLIAKLIKATPEKSDRQIAETVKASPTTVGTVRAEMEAKGDVSKLDTRQDSKGRRQPAKRSKRKRATDPPPEIAQRRAAAAHRIRELMGKPPKPPDDIGPASAGEIARKDAEIEELRNAKQRLEIKITGLESEITELKTRREPASAARCEICRQEKRATQRRVFVCDLCAEIHELETRAEAAPPADDGLDIPACLDRRNASPPAKGD
jgi:hypothetical protein